MVTYFELKQYIGRLFGQRNLEDNDDDISVSLPNQGSCSDENSTSFMISNSELKALYDKVSMTSTDNLEFITQQSYEIAVNLDYPFLRRNDYPIISNDVSNGIKYTLGYPSIEYCIFLIIEIIENYKTNGRRPMLPLRLHRTMDYWNRAQNNTEVTFQTLLPQIISELSLRIDADKSTSPSDFRDYKTSFSFQFMYRSGFALIEFLDIDDIFHLNRTTRDRIDFTQLDTPPLRKYSSDVVDYYKLALSSNDPYIEYLSFYHIMEYFYDEVFKKKMVEDLRGKITHPDFVYKDDDKVYQIALFVKNRMQMDDKSGLGDERESLKYVLCEYVPIDDLKTRISLIDPNATQYYQSTKVGFCNAPIVPWGDTQGVYGQLAKRIYFTRNSLVHSKSGKNNERYKPYSDELQLQKEIPLAKAIAELIIINSSSIM